jgi:pimeloyl-ACP methyl ester carboxylesterase
VAEDRPVILVDYRGVGRSRGEMPDSISTTAADIIVFVKALGLKEIDLFGFSIGGRPLSLRTAYPGPYF